MGRLIPLKLQPISAARKEPSTQLSDQMPPPIPVKSPRRLKPEIPPSSPLPQTQNDWRTILDGVRNTYLRRQYGQCSARCIQLLEAAPDTVPSLHCIYLSFYAAICLELTARSLPIGSPQKLSLFCLARVYYQKAEHYMGEAESEHSAANINIMKKISLKIHQRFPSSSSDSSGNSARSSLITGQHSTPSYKSSSSMPSPVSSVCSSCLKSEDETCDPLRPQPLRIVKTVSTCTSGAAEASTSLMTPKTFQSGLDSLPSQDPSSYSTAIQPMAPNKISYFLFARSITRYNTHLSTLRTQLNRHLSTIAGLISPIESTQCLPTELKSDQADGLNKRDNSSTLFDDHKPALPHISELEREERARRRRIRIAELKQRGIEWKQGKGRFDGSKYEQLCRVALEELQVRSASPYKG